jgi:hypothetical protein
MDFKGLGYFISTFSVILMGIVAWPKPGEPQWHAVLLASGMAASIAGMGVRWLSHRNDRKDIHRVERKAERQTSR